MTCSSHTRERLPHTAQHTQHAAQHTHILNLQHNRTTRLRKWRRTPSIVCTLFVEKRKRRFSHHAHHARFCKASCTNSPSVERPQERQTSFAHATLVVVQKNPKFPARTRNSRSIAITLPSRLLGDTSDFTRCPQETFPILSPKAGWNWWRMQQPTV